LTETFPIPFGRYQLLERLAVGGMAELFLAHDRSSARAGDKPVVIKRLLPHMASQSHFKDMFLDEAKLTKRLSHPNIAQTYDFGRFGEQLFIAMEFVDGIDGLALLRECAHRKVRLPPEIAVYATREVLDALDFAHTQLDDKGEPLGVVHRDISPSNVLLARSGDIKLVDFGIARAAQRSHHTKDGTLKGKYGYMSPEQVIDDVVDARSDLFSVGIVLAELLTGRRLFAAPNELDVLLMVRDGRLDRLDRYGRHIGVDLDRLLRKALRKQRDERFDSAADFRDAIDEWMRLHQHEITGKMIGEMVESFYEDAWKRKRGMVPGALWQQHLAEAGLAQGTPAPGSGPRLVRDTAEVPGAGPVAEIQGIPVGQGRDSGVMPVISIDDAESAPIGERAVTGTVQAPDGVVAITGEWSETERMDSAMARMASEPITIELTDMTGDAEIADSVAEFTPEPLAGDVDAVPRPAEEILSRPASSPGAGMIFDSTDAAMDALSLGDDPDTLHESNRLVAPKSVAAAAAAVRAEAPAKAKESAPPPPALSPEPVAKSPDEARAPELGDPDDAGDFAASPPIGVLYRLAVSRASGLLVVGVGGIRKEIYFREGIPEYVSSNVTNELFGEYLVQEGVLSSGELSMALAMMPRYKNRLGDTLVGLNLLTPLEVLRYLTRQVRKKLVDVCTWGRGSFAWYAGHENTREAFPLDLNAFEVLGAGALDTPAEVMESWLSKVGDTRPRLVKRGRVRPEVFQLGTFMRDVCRALDGTRTLADLRVEFEQRDQHDRFVRVLYLLTQTDLAVSA
jgi:eukaryotic-like serine/threonine-protein kinase